MSTAVIWENNPLPASCNALADLQQQIKIGWLKLALTSPKRAVRHKYYSDFIKPENSGLEPVWVHKLAQKQTKWLRQQHPSQVCHHLQFKSTVNYLNPGLHFPTLYGLKGLIRVLASGLEHTHDEDLGQSFHQRKYGGLQQQLEKNSTCSNL